jgi:hypothetical protein
MEGNPYQPIDDMQRALASQLRRTTWRFYWLGVLPLAGLVWAAIQRSWGLALFAWIAGWYLSCRKAGATGFVRGAAAWIGVLFLALFTWPFYWIRELPLYLGRTPHLASRVERKQRGLGGPRP